MIFPGGTMLSISLSFCTEDAESQEMLASSGFINTPRTQAAAQTLFSVSLAGNDLFKTDILRVHYTSCLGLESL